jgi:tetratricopeptide (TPR) repeat protein
LTATQHRVPRWFTEGVAVYEETATHPDWGDRLDPEAIKAIKDKKLLPIAELDRGFIRPEYPSQVVVSYFQGGQTCIYIVERWGWDKILAMIQDFSAETSTADVIKKELGLEPAAFDKDFLAWLDKRTHTQVENFDSWKDKMKGLAGNVAAKKWDDVIAEGPRIRGLYPDYLEGDNAYEFLSEAYLAKGDKQSAARELEDYSKEGGKNPATVKRLADLQVELGRKQDAARTLERLNFVYPQDEELHSKLGGIYLDLGQTSPAIRELEVLVAMKPNDMAGAHYQLALAYQKGGRLDDAKDQVLLSLEAAPGFRPAQKLLLELTRGARPSSDAAALSRTQK